MVKKRESKSEAKSEPRPEKLLTEVELELMGILWKINEGSVNEVLLHLSPDRKLAYTSVSTVLRILEQKGVVGNRKEGRGHIYFPLLGKVDYEATSLHHLVDKVFDGTPSSLVKRLFDSEKMSAEDLREIQSLLDQRLR